MEIQPEVLRALIIIVVGAVVAGWGLFFALRHAHHPRLIDYQSYTSPLSVDPGEITGGGDFHYNWYHDGPSDRVVVDEEGNILQVYNYRFKSGLIFNDCAYSFQKYAPGQAVEVEYPTGRPELARVKGMRAQPIPFWDGVLPYLAALAWMILVGVGTWRLFLRALQPRKPAAPQEP